MDTFEQAFSATEKAADSTLRSANGLVRQIKELQKAAQVGNIAGIKRAQERIDAALGVLRQEVVNSAASWPFPNHEEEQYLKTGYITELHQVAQGLGLQVHERDGRLVAHPLMVRVLPGERAVRIDKKQTSNIRPSHLAEVLLVSQKKPVRYQSAAFLEALYIVYKDFVHEDNPNRLVKGSGRVVPLEEIYKRLTYLPGSSREYERADFARAVYDLDASSVKKTRSGATVSFPSSTGTRSSRGLFTFVGPDGADVQYYAIRFTEEG